MHFFICASLYRQLHACDLLVDEQHIELETIREPVTNTDGEYLNKNTKDTDIQDKNNSHRKACWSYTYRCFGFHLLTNSRFLSFCLFLVFLFMAIDINVSFMTSSAREKGFSEKDITLLLICTNCFDVPVRLIAGTISDLRKVREHRSFAYAIGTSMFGVTSIVVPFVQGKIGIMCIWVITIATRSAILSQVVAVITQISGRSDISSAVGLGPFFMGIGLLLGPVMGGKL